MNYKIYASEIAALIGENPYRDAYVVLLDVWKRMGLVAVETKKETVDRVIKKAKLDTALSDSKKTGDTKNLEAAIASVTTLSEEEKTLLNSQIDSFRKTSLGVFAETKEVKKSKIRQNNGTLYHRFASTDQLEIIGRIDGFDPVKGLVEIKRRMKMIYQTPPKYDLIQCMCYLFLTQSTEMTLLELGPRGKRKETKVRWNDQDWKAIVTKLLDLFNQTSPLLQNQTLLDKWALLVLEGDIANAKVALDLACVGTKITDLDKKKQEEKK